MKRNRLASAGQELRRTHYSLGNERNLFNFTLYLRPYKNFSISS